jgi:hypothetical protein
MTNAVQTSTHAVSPETTEAAVGAAAAAVWPCATPAINIPATAHPAPFSHFLLFIAIPP